MIRVLLIDDEPATNTLVTSYLGLAGFSVVAAIDAATGLQAFGDGTAFDAVIVDRRLPDMDGAEVCARLKRVRKLPVLMLTASSGALPPGPEAPDHWMAKPFKPKELVAELKRLTGAA